MKWAFADISACVDWEMTLDMLDGLNKVSSDLSDIVPKLTPKGFRDKTSFDREPRP